MTTPPGGVVWPTIDPEHLASSGTAWQIFPNFQIGQGLTTALCYSARPHGYDPDQCIFEASCYELYPEGAEPHTEWVYAPPEDPGWRSVLPQDFSNMAAVQQGMKSLGFRGPKPNPYMERSTANLHRHLAEIHGHRCATRPSNRDGVSAMKVNLGFGAHNSHDWDRVLAGDFSQPPATPDWECVQGTLAIADLAEPLGFDGIWMPEHCGTPYGMTPNPIQALSYFAGRTERVGLGTFVVVAPWWHPVRLAHQIAYLDILSNGRYTTIGIGRGVSKGEFDAVGVPREESRQRFNETLDILQLAFSGERFSYEGEIFKVPEMSLRPEPISRDLFSRIYSSSSTAESLENPVPPRDGPAFRGQQADRGRRTRSAAGQHVPQGGRPAALSAEERDVHVLHA